MSNGTITMTGAEYDALAGKIAALEAELAKLRAVQEPVLYVNGQHLALALDNHDKEGRSASVSTVKGHYCDTPLYTAPQPSAVLDVSRMARVLSDRAASACCVDPEDNWKVYGHEFIDDVQAMLEVAPCAPAPIGQHPDDAAVDAFAVAMKAKLAKARAKGRGGWDDKAQCSQQHLSDLLRGHVDKGDPVDVANFCMMLSQRGEGIAPAPATTKVHSCGLDTTSACLACNQSVPNTAPTPAGWVPVTERYTCIGKGGSYELIGRADCAGTLRHTGRFTDEVIVYRDIESGNLYCRDPGDFMVRMEKLPAAPSAEGEA